MRYSVSYWPSDGLGSIIKLIDRRNNIVVAERLTKSPVTFEAFRFWCDRLNRVADDGPVINRDVKRAARVNLAQQN